MKKEDLINNGWKSENCKIGTLYFKDGFFCRFKTEDTVLVFHSSDDMHYIGVAENIEQLEEAQKEYRKNQIKMLKLKYEAAKNYYEKTYNEKLD